MLIYGRMKVLATLTILAALAGLGPTGVQKNSPAVLVKAITQLPLIGLKRFSVSVFVDGDEEDPRIPDSGALETFTGVQLMKNMPKILILSAAEARSAAPIRIGKKEYYDKADVRVLVAVTKIKPTTSYTLCVKTSVALPGVIRKPAGSEVVDIPLMVTVWETPLSLGIDHADGLSDAIRSCIQAHVELLASDWLSAQRLSGK